MKHIIILSELQLWSMENKCGAPSFYNTVKAYVDAGWDTYLLYPDNGISSGINGLNEVRFITPFEEFLNIGKLSFFIKEYRYWCMMKSFIKNAEKIISSLDDASNTIIYAYEVAAVKAGKKLAQKYNIKLVTRFQGTILSNENKIAFQKMRLHIHYDALAENADLVIMTNDGTMGDKILKELKNKSKLLFLINGLDKLDEDRIFKDEILDGIKSDTKVLLTVSRLVSWKRVDRAIIALKDVVKIRDDVKLLIVGDGAEREKLEVLVKENGLDNYVIFAGAQPHEKIYSYMKKADVFLSLYDLSNMGNPLFEAMMCGLPIITTDVGATGSVITNNENGILLDHNNLKDISGKMLYLIENPDFANTIGLNAKRFAKEHFMTWSERMEFEIKEVEKLLEGFDT